MILLLEKLLQSSKTGIELLLASAAFLVQVLAASAANTLTIRLAQRSQMPWMAVVMEPVITRTPAVFLTMPSATTGSVTG